MNKWTRIDNVWCVMSSSAELAGTEVLVWSKRKGEQSVPLAEYIGPHPKVDGRYVYAIDKAKGAKGPNAATTAEPTPTAKPAATVEPVTGAGAGDALAAVLNDILSKPQIDGEMVESIARAAVEQALIDFKPEAMRVEIDVRTPAGLRSIEGVQHKVLPKVLDSLAVGNHVFLTGPAGSGKTTLAEQTADALDRELFVTGAMLTKHEAVGYCDANGNYVTTATRQAYETGAVLNWDEVDSSSPHALVAVNAMLSNSTYTFPDGTVERHPDFVVIASGNTYGRGADREYVGRMQLDASTLDRFDFIDCDYDEELELALASANFEAFGGTDVSKLTMYVSKVQQYRATASEKKVKHVISPRASINGAKLLARGVVLAEVMDRCIWKGIPEDTRKQIAS
jgi:cobaltochelatase CobS